MVSQVLKNKIQEFSSFVHKNKQKLFYMPNFKLQYSPFFKGSCNFSWFYKIPHLLKWLNLPVYYIFFSINAISFKIFLVRQKYIFFEKEKCFWWENKNDKKNFNLKSWKSQILIFGHFGRFLISQIQFFLSFLVSYKKNIFFLRANILLSYQKKFWASSSNREKDIL